MKPAGRLPGLAIPSEFSIEPEPWAAVLPRGWVASSPGITVYTDRRPVVRSHDQDEDHFGGYALVGVAFILGRRSHDASR